jgi:hypothetical protein
MTRVVSALVAAGFLWAASDLAAQTPPRKAVPPRKPAAPQAQPVRVSVRDNTGAALADVHLVLSGASTGEFTTGGLGTAILPDLKPGTYRVRAEHDGFVTLEREFTLGTGTWNPIELVLNPAPPPPKPAPEPAPPATSQPGGPPVSVSIPDFLDKNFIGREPIKESILACKPLETVRLLQLREALAPHVHDRVDEIIYVVAGEGAVRIGDEATALRAGAVFVVPSGSRHGFERRGKNPLILVSILAGAACEAPKP